MPLVSWPFPQHGMWTTDGRTEGNAEDPFVKVHARDDTVLTSRHASVRIRAETNLAGRYERSTNV